MERLGQFEVAKRVVVPPANMLSVSLEPFVAQPGADLGITDAQSACTLGNRKRVANMIAVTMRDEM